MKAPGRRGNYPLLGFSASLKPSLQQRPPVISMMGSEALEKYRSEDVNLYGKRHASGAVTERLHGYHIVTGALRCNYLCFIENEMEGTVTVI